MKQQISVDQLNELSAKGKEKLVYWIHENTKHDKKHPSEHDLNLSIGQMIEFTQENLRTDWSVHFGRNLAFVGRADKDGFWGKTPDNRGGELCDGLWEVVKEILNKDL